MGKADWRVGGYPMPCGGCSPRGGVEGGGREDVALKAGRGQFQAEAESRGRGGSAVGRRPSRQTKAG